MNQEYADLISRLGPPLWWDEYSVPRYVSFAPSMCNNIYADEACLLKIACQNCGQTFLVAMSWSRMDGMLRDRPRLSETIRAGWIHWGDPPYHEDPAGNTENCEDLRVMEFWQKERFDWERMPELEIVLQDHWSGEDW